MEFYALKLFLILGRVPFKNEMNEYNLVQYQINGNEIKKISEKNKVHKDAIRNVYYLGNNVILSCTSNDEVKIWY